MSQSSDSCLFTMITINYWWEAEETRIRQIRLLPGLHQRSLFIKYAYLDKSISIPSVLSLFDI
jgi:hypothetical protein